MQTTLITGEVYYIEQQEQYCDEVLDWHLIVRIADVSHDVADTALSHLFVCYELVVDIQG